MITIDMSTLYVSTLKLNKIKAEEVTKKIKQLKTEHYISGDYEFYS